MAEVTISINGRDYDIACNDSEVEKVKNCALQIKRHVETLTRSLGGEIGHARLLLMAGLLITEELMELRKAGDLVSAEDKDLIKILDKAAQKVEKLTKRLES